LGILGVLGAEEVGDPLWRLRVLRDCRLGHRLDGDPLDVGELPRERARVEGRLDRVVGSREGVGRAVVAIDAVHHPDLVHGRLALEFVGAEHPRGAVALVDEPHPRDGLPLLVGGVI
ncbi:MAG: hypothetical protein ACK55I_29335, partial [bacterium]